MGPIGIFGGTFDPIHYGHLRTALELLEVLSLSQVSFIPCGQQPLRDEPTAPAESRLSLLRAAIADEPRFCVDTRELEREGLSYSVDTLTGLREEHPSESLCLLLGMDSFLSLPQWHRWEELVGLAHLVVAHRPGWQAPVQGLLGDLIGERGTEHAQDLGREAAGRVFVTPRDPIGDFGHRVEKLDKSGAGPQISGS